MMYYHEGNGMDDTASDGWVASSLAYLTGTCTDMPWTDATSERTEAMSYDTWDEVIDAARTAGRQLGRTITEWRDVPRRDADQLINEATDAFKDAAVDMMQNSSEGR